MKTLHLNVKRKWFDQILAGEKTEEYREFKAHWVKQFLQCYQDKRDGKSKFECKKANCYSCLTRAKGGRFKKYDTVTFSNGYAKDRPQFEIELKRITIKKEKSKWGIAPSNAYFILKLGEIIKR